MLVRSVVDRNMHSVSVRAGFESDRGGVLRGTVYRCCHRENHNGSRGIIEIPLRIVSRVRVVRSRTLWPPCHLIPQSIVVGICGVC